MANDPPFLYQPWAVRINGNTTARFEEKQDALDFLSIKVGSSVAVELRYDVGE